MKGYTRAPRPSTGKSPAHTRIFLVYKILMLTDYSREALQWVTESSLSFDLLFRRSA